MANTKTALVAGGTGGLGEGIVRALLEGGWTVWVPYRSLESSERLKASTLAVASGRLHLKKCDLSVPFELQALRHAILDESPTIDLVVVSVGSSYYGHSLHKIILSAWEKLLEENLLTHFHLQQAFLPQLQTQDSGTYVTLTGPEADFAHPETGLLSIFAAAQKMMARVEALETSGTKVRCYSVTSKTPIATAARGEQTASDWLTPHELGRYVQGLAEGKVPGLGDPLHVLENRGQLEKLLASSR